LALACGVTGSGSCSTLLLRSARSGSDSWRGLLGRHDVQRGENLQMYKSSDVVLL
jgi:hypothetical protein